MAKKKTIHYMRELAKKRHGKCLSDVYVNSRSKLSWECKYGHRWKATPANVACGTWCPKCAMVIRAKKFKLTIQQMRQLAMARGGKCISETYVNSQTGLLWECKQGHRWVAKPLNIKNGTWCPKCAAANRGKRPKLTIEEMKRIAKKLGGTCLSRNYTNNRTKLLWECKEGHRWEAMPLSIKEGVWCPKCAAARSVQERRLRIQEMRQLAGNRGGRCLSRVYMCYDTKLVWQCKEGHRWEARANDVRAGTWCPTCGAARSVEKRKLTIKQMRQIARGRGGRCLSKTYINNQTKLRWQCKEGHKWSTTPKHIKAGSWCPYCARERRRQKPL